jgi:hypothetical protein
MPPRGPIDRIVNAKTELVVRSYTRSSSALSNWTMTDFDGLDAGTPVNQGNRES